MGGINPNRPRAIVLIAAFVLVALATAAYWATTHFGGPHTDPLAVDTPPGITLQPLGGAQGYGDGRPGTIKKGGGAAQVAFTDAAGRTLYAYDKDAEPGKASCAGDCAKSWPAALAPSDAKPAGDWSIIQSEDGHRQWAYRGKPLYTFASDTKIGDSKGSNAADGAWHAILAEPVVRAPVGITLQEVPDAAGYALTDPRGMTLYSFDGKSGGEPPCLGDPCIRRWLPLKAGAVANGTGDFTPIVRADGITQWAYKGRPLYTFTGDIEPLDANGIDVDETMHAALVSRHFMPPGIKIQQSLANGKILTDAAGMTIYRRDAFRQEVGIHGLAHGIISLPAFGRMIGTRGCDAGCLRDWRPVKAPADATPSGYWDVAARDDGTKQWVYKGYALYTYGGDKAPGDMNGNDIYDYLIHDQVNKLPDIPPGLQQVGAGALYWAFVAP
jgi:predicted lipoprotein with Yx(FWY)xxD motif